MGTMTMTQDCKDELLKEGMIDEILRQKTVIWRSFNRTRKRTAC